MDILVLNAFDCVKNVCYTWQPGTGSVTHFGCDFIMSQRQQSFTSLSLILFCNRNLVKKGVVGLLGGGMLNNKENEKANKRFSAVFHFPAAKASLAPKRKQDERK